MTKKNLGRVGFVDRGPWAAGTEYSKFDVVSVADHGSYYSRTNENTGHNPVGDAVNWAPVAAGDYAKQQGDYAKQQGDYAHDQAEQIAAKANTADLQSGALVPKKAETAENLESWKGANLTTDDTQGEVVFTTGGDESIDSSVPAEFKMLGAETDFAATSLVCSGKNLLRLLSNNGVAVAVGAGYYFPVPALAFGTINTAEQPNGVLFTDQDGNNLRPTVRFKPYSDGVPTSVNDGTACAYTDATIDGKSYRFYNTSRGGYMIVSGITWATTCARIAWSGGGFPYDAFVSPTDENDAGTIIPLAATITAAHSYGKLLTVGGVSDRIEREDNTHLRWTTLVDRVQPEWTSTLQEDGTTYLHTATIGAMKRGGAAQFETQNQVLQVDGNTISYSDSNTVALLDYVKYEKATADTGLQTVNTTNPSVEDYGIIAIIGATGQAYTTFYYAQGIPDNLRAIASAKMQAQLMVVAEALGVLFYDGETMRRNLQGENGQRINLVLGEVDATGLRRMGFPMEVEGAGTPSADVVPSGWEKLCPGVAWTGVPFAPGMMYYDSTNNHWYKAKLSLTGSVSDWVPLF